MIFPMSENWWIEKDKAYFCGTRLSALFCTDMSSLQCELVAWLPESDMVDFFVHPYCMKYKDFIVCLPGTGKEIWFYDMKRAVWEKTEINNEGQFIISMETYRQPDGRIWLLEYDTGRILQLNLDKKTVEKEYRLSEDGREVYYGEYVVVDNRLYTTVDNRVYCIDTMSSDVTVYEIPEAKAGLFTICYDGSDFWLGGYSKEIYVWNPLQGTVKILTKFPEQFGVYHFHEAPYVDYATFSHTTEENPFFQYSICLGKYIWYLPTQSNGVIYIDKETYEIRFLEIEDEQETQESLERDYANKFLFEYIREDRYLGIYSILNERVFEIDTVALCKNHREYELGGKTILTLGETFGQYDGSRIFREKAGQEQIYFNALVKASGETDKKTIHNIGEQIYHTLNK